MIEPALIQKMSIAERLQTMEQLWDALREEEAKVASPDWHGETLAERKARAEKGEAKFLMLAQLRSRLRESKP
ncbi:MAG TPA: addiction module protein [Verrucomicrobiae bacterium]